MSQPNSKWAPILFGLILSGLMSLMVSGITLVRSAGVTDGFMLTWLAAWITAWAVAFPAVLIVAPIARRIVGRVFKS